MRSPWPSEQIKMLLRMRAAGFRTENMAREITLRFGVRRSRRAVLSKLNRLPNEPPPGPQRAGVEAGVRYGNLVFIEPVPRRGRLWRFRCDCGARTVKSAARVKSGSVASCGYCQRAGAPERPLRANEPAGRQ
jgi:hypothetical protein